MPLTEKILKSLLKVGLKAAVPILGDIVVTVVEEGGSLLIDHLVEKRARDLHSRLFKRMQEQAEALIRAESLDAKRLEYLLPTIELIMSRHGIRLDEWSQAHFSAERTTEIVLERAADTLIGLSDDDLGLIRMFLGTFHAALLDASETLRATEADFRSMVLDRLDSLPDDTARHAAARAEAATNLAAGALIGLPQRPWRSGISPPGALLRADIEGGVPFHGRQDETASITSWCAETAPVGVRLYTGAGGMGKTRLFIEMCRQLRAQRWQAGFLDHRAAGAPATMWSRLAHQHGALFLVVDYAETRRAELVALLREVFQVGHDRRVRIVLLARAADDWWEQLKTEREGVGDLLRGPATRRFSLGPLALSMDYRVTSYQLSAVSFAERLKKEPPLDLPDDLDDDIYKRVLFLHMRALAAIDGVQIKGDQGILNYVLDRERAFWSERARARGLTSLIEPGIAQAIAVLTLGGGADSRDHAIATFKQIPLLKDQDTAVLNGISALLHDTYPGAKWIEPVLPDLLGEHLVQVEVEKDPDGLFNLVFGAREATNVGVPGG